MRGHFVDFFVLRNSIEFLNQKSEDISEKKEKKELKCKKLVRKLEEKQTDFLLVISSQLS